MCRVRRNGISRPNGLDRLVVSRAPRLPGPKPSLPGSALTGGATLGSVFDRGQKETIRNHRYSQVSYGQPLVNIEVFASKAGEIYVELMKLLEPSALV